MTTEAAGVLYRPTALGEPFRPALESSQAGAVLQEASTLEELAHGFVNHRDGDRTFVGIDPDQDLLMSAGTSVSVGSLPLLLACAKDIPTLSAAPIPLLSHSARRGRRRDASRE